MFDLRKNWRLVAMIVAAVVTLFVVLWAWEAVKAPFVWAGERLCLDGSDCAYQRAKTDLETERSRSGALTEQTEAREVIAREAERSHTVIVETRTVATEAVAATHGAPDADTPLSPDLAGVLGDADRRMCMAEPASCPGSAADR